MGQLKSTSRGQWRGYCSTADYSIGLQTAHTVSLSLGYLVKIKKTSQHYSNDKLMSGQITQIDSKQ